MLLIRGCLLLWIVGSISLLTSKAFSDEKLEGIACRSIHFGYPGDDADLFYNEITVQQSAPGTYFCVIGWNKGYFGIQQLADDRRVAIFSVWDSGDNDPNALPNEQRTQVLYVDPEVTVKRFGGEGSGGQSFLPFDWKEGQTYKFVVTSRVVDNRTAYSGWIKMDDQWRHLITFSTITGGKPMNGFYSFVEDFKRDRKSATQNRKAVFANMFRHQIANNQSVLQTKARFTGDSNPVLNIDAQSLPEGIQLSTGGKIKNEHIQLNQNFEFENKHPIDAQMVSDLIESSKKKSRTAQERKQESQQTMRSKEIPFLDRLVTLPMISATHRRTPTEVWQRFLIETAIAAKADGSKQGRIDPLLQSIDQTLLSTDELQFLQAVKPNINDEVEYLWHAERAYVLAWSLGLVGSLPWPNHTAKPEDLLALTDETNNEKSLSLVPQSSLIDHADLTYRMHWSVLNAKYMDRDAPDHLQIDVLAERHHAFAWLLGLPSLEQQMDAEPITWHKVKPTISLITEFATPIQ